MLSALKQCLCVCIYMCVCEYVYIYVCVCSPGQCTIYTVESAYLATVLDKRGLLIGLL